MPFKIVSTRKKGRAELCTVPFHWENKGKLRWPKYNADSLCKDENSRPGPDWISMNCDLKRQGFLSYNDAEEELNDMLNKTDTDTDNDQSNRHGSLQNSKTTEYPNLNSLAHCLTNSSIATTDTGTFGQNSSSVINDSNFNIYEVVTEEDSRQIIENTVIQQAANVGDPILQHIENIYVVQKVIMDNQEKIMKKLSELSVQFEESLRNREPLVTTLKQAQGMPTKRFMIKAIDNIQGLQQLDAELSTPEGFGNLQEKYSILCSVQRGNGTNCAYRLLDALFTKDFLCKCSWTGGSRNADVKIGFKGYKNTIKFFFVMINSWDDTYTMEKNEDFFKTVLRNALKRKDSKNVRLSAPKKRAKKNTSKKNVNADKNGIEENENDSNNDNKNDSVINIGQGPENNVMPENSNENESKNDNDNGSNNDNNNDSDIDNGRCPENNVLPGNSNPPNQSGENRTAQQEEEEDEESLR